MKTNLIKKYKWYLFGAIAVVLIMSIGLSFCAWDSQSITSAINGKVAEYNKYPQEWMAKNVGEDFTDSKNFKWLIVDRRTVNNVTTMVLMSYYVTDTRHYGTVSNPDYNHETNNIRSYLNTSWYPTVAKELRALVVPKVTSYQAGTVFPIHRNPDQPPIVPVAPTSNFAWLPSENEIGFVVKEFGLAQEYIHDEKFQYFDRTEVFWQDGGDWFIGNNEKRIATKVDGKAVSWFTRTGKLSHMVTTVSDLGGMCCDSRHWSGSSNYLRPCIQVRFNG